MVERKKSGAVKNNHIVTDGKIFGIERKGIGYGVKDGNLPFVFPTAELANKWLCFVAELAADLAK